MESFRYLTSQIRQYFGDREIVEFMRSNPNLNEVVTLLEEAKSTVVIPLVSLENEVQHTFNLQVIVKHDKQTNNGFYEYFLVEDFVNKKTNLYALLFLVCIGSGADLDHVIDHIHTQLTELCVTINQEYLLRTVHDKKRIYFEKSIREVGLN